MEKEKYPSMETLTVKASTLSKEVRLKMGLAPDEMVDICPHKSIKTPKNTQSEVKRMQKFLDSIVPATGVDNTDSAEVIRSLREGREGRASSNDDDNQ